MICISMCSKETTTDLKLKYLHYRPGLRILASLKDGCLVKYPYICIDLFVLYIEGYL